MHYVYTYGYVCIYVLHLKACDSDNISYSFRRLREFSVTENEKCEVKTSMEKNFCRNRTTYTYTCKNVCMYGSFV